MDFSVCPKQQEVIVRNSANCRHGSPISPARPRNTTLFRPWLCTSGRESMERRNCCLQKEETQYQRYYYESDGRNEPTPEGPVYIRHKSGVCQQHGCAQKEYPIPSMTLHLYASVHANLTRAQPPMYDVQKNTFTHEPSRNSNANMDLSAKLFATSNVYKNAFAEISTQDTYSRNNRGKFNVCDICKKSFSKNTSMESHLRVHTGEKPYACNVCKKAFSTKGYLKMHFRFHAREKPYECDTCLKSFTQKCDLNIHVRIHTGEKPYKCNACGTAFSQKKHMQTHYRIHTGEKPYVCGKCKKAFTRKDHLNRHFLLHKE